MILRVGLSHHTTPLEVRARCAVLSEQRHAAFASLAHHFGHVVLIATCGRLELYLDPEEGDVARTLDVAEAWFARRANVDTKSIAPHITLARGEDAVRHVVRVACGLDSALVGEDEILGQVRRGWLDASLAGVLSPTLDAAFRLAVCTGRQARRMDGGSGWTSLADAAAADVATVIASLSSPRVLVAGTGPMGLRAARSLRARFGDRLALAMAGRTSERTITRANDVDARPISLAEMPEALAWADAAVVGLRTRAPLIRSVDIPTRPASRPLLIVDLSVPRAVDADISDREGITLHDVDQLGVGSRGHGRWDTDGRARVDALVEEAVHQHTNRGVGTDTAETLVTLRLQAEAVRRSLVAQTLPRLPHMDDEARWRLDALTHAIVNRLLHEPTMRLREDRSGHAAEQVRSIFGLTEH